MAMATPERSPCKGCGNPIVWARNPQGGSIPLDPTPPVYNVRTYEDGSIRCERNPNAMVTHFATCSAVDLFSKGKKEQLEGWEAIRDENGSILYLQKFEGDPPEPGTMFRIFEETWEPGRPPRRLVKVWKPIVPNIEP